MNTYDHKRMIGKKEINKKPYWAHHWYKFGDNCKQKPNDTLSNRCRISKRRGLSPANMVATSPVLKADVPNQACLHLGGVA